MEKNIPQEGTRSKVFKKRSKKTRSKRMSLPMARLSLDATGISGLELAVVDIHKLARRMVNILNSFAIQHGNEARIISASLVPLDETENLKEAKIIIIPFTCNNDESFEAAKSALTGLKEEFPEKKYILFGNEQVQTSVCETVYYDITCSELGCDLVMANLNEEFSIFISKLTPLIFPEGEKTEEKTNMADTTPIEKKNALRRFARFIRRSMSKSESTEDSC